jgi:hypothetical protein
MEVKRGIKRSRVYVSASSSSSNETSMPPSFPIPSSSLSASSLKGSSQGPPSPMHEHGEPSEVFPVVDLTSEEEDAPDTSRDEKIAWKLFSDLNHGLLGPPSNDNIIVLNDSEEEEEVQEDDRANAEAAPSSIGNSLAPSTSATADDDAPDKVQDDSSGGGTPDRV